MDDCLVNRYQHTKNSAGQMVSSRKLSMCYQRIIFRLFLSILFIGATTCLYAQEDDDSLKVELDPIKVTAIHSTISAADAPISLSTLSRDLQSINHNTSLSLNSIGNELPGLWVNDRQNYALGERLTIRGVGWRAAFGVRGIQVVLNGMPLTVADGQTMINIVDPAFIRRAELVRGPAATYWGNSSGGVLYLSTRPTDNQQEFSARVRSMAGSFGMRKGEAEVSFNSQNHQMTAYSSYLTSDGFRNYSSANVWRSGITGSVNLTSRSQLQYQAASIYMPKAQHPSSLTAQDAEENPTMAVPSFVSSEAGKQMTQGQAGLSYILDTNAGLLNITGYGIYRDLNNPLPFGIITVDRGVGGLRATYDKSWDNFDLQFGTESKLQNDDRIEYVNAGNAQKGDITVDQLERVWNQALFATGTLSLGEFNVLGGLRFDRLTFSTDAPTDSLSGERTFQALSPSIGVNYQPGNQTIFLNLSTSFEAPTTTELVNRPGGGNGFNPELKPEQTVGLELGVRGSDNQQKINYDIAAYRLWIQDLLFPYQLNPNGPTLYRNQGQTNHTGLEGRIAVNLNRNWSVSTTANLTNAEFIEATVDSTSLTGKNVPGIPDFRFHSQLSWSPGAFLGSVSYEFISGYDVNNLNTEQNEQYGVVDAKLSYQKIFTGSSVQLQPFINLNNLFDTRYNGSVVVNSFGGRYYEPAPGRNWQLGLSVDF